MGQKCQPRSNSSYIVIFTTLSSEFSTSRNSLIKDNCSKYCKCSGFNSYKHGVLFLGYRQT